MERWRIVAAGALIGIAAVAFQFGWSGDVARDMGRYLGGAIGGILLAYLFTRARGWTH